MEVLKCEICLSKKTALKCYSCNKYSCKHCMQFIDENIFLLQSLLPEHIRDKSFCPICFDDDINDQLNKYLDIMERAKNVNVYEKIQSSETRLMRRVQKTIKVLECDDREETLIRLAYLAAEQGFDTIVDVDIISKKVNQGGRHKKLIWSGSAIPIDPKKSR